jgi:hypothetical protein
VRDRGARARSFVLEDRHIRGALVRAVAIDVHLHDVVRVFDRVEGIVVARRLDDHLRALDRRVFVRERAHVPGLAGLRDGGGSVTLVAGAERAPLLGRIAERARPSGAPGRKKDGLARQRMRAEIHT